MKCIVKGCENHKNQGGFKDKMCLPCYLFITTGEGIYSQAYRNTKPADLTDEEIVKLHEETSFFGVLDPIKFARAILRKAQEK